MRLVSGECRRASVLYRLYLARLKRRAVTSRSRQEHRRGTRKGSSLGCTAAVRFLSSELVFRFFGNKERKNGFKRPTRLRANPAALVCETVRDPPTMLLELSENVHGQAGGPHVLQRRLQTAGLSPPKTTGGQMMGGTLSFARHVSRRHTSARKSRARPSRRQRALCDPIHGVRFQWEVTLVVPTEGLFKGTPPP